MIKQNKSELANIEFKIEATIAINFLCIFLFWAALKITISLELYVQFWWGFQHNIALTLWHTMEMKIEFDFFSSSDSFCLITSHNMLHVDNFPSGSFMIYSLYLYSFHSHTHYFSLEFITRYKELHTKGAMLRYCISLSYVFRIQCSVCWRLYAIR